MKAIVMISRVGQIIILAIAFMACVGWNQAAGLQNSIASITHKRVKDIVKIRYILPQTNLHSMPKSCETPDLNTSFETKSGTGNLNNRITWNGVQNMEKQSDLSCNTDSRVLKPSLAVASSCQSRLSVSNALQGRGYFSGFQKPSETNKSVIGSTQSMLGSASLVSETVNVNKKPVGPVYIVFGNAGCTVTACHSKKNTSDTVEPTLLDGNIQGDDEYFTDGVSQPVTMECQPK